VQFIRRVWAWLNSFTSNVDMKTGAPPHCGTPEYVRATQMMTSGQMARFYGLILRSNACASMRRWSGNVGKLELVVGCGVLAVWSITRQAWLEGG
jgi:hypothetical protein